MTSYKPFKHRQQKNKIARWQRCVDPIKRFFTRRVGKKDKNNQVPLVSYGVKKSRTTKVFFTKYFSAALLLGSGVLLVLGGYWFLTSSDVFKLSTINVEGTYFVSRQDVLNSGALEPGLSLLELKTKNLEAAIGSLPWVERVTVQKQWPSALSIHVREQKPIALVNVEQGTGESQLFYVNNKGDLFAPYRQGQDLDYPVLTGKKRSEKEKVLTLSSSRAEESALLFLKLAAKGNPILPIQSISEVHMSDKHGIVVYLVDQPFPIYFGDEKIYTKYYRLVKILERLYRKKAIDGIESIRMDYAEDKILVARAEIDR